MNTSNAGDHFAMRARLLFMLGRLDAMLSALRALKQHRVDPIKLLTRHVSGDWGELPFEDSAQIEIALLLGGRVFSSYTIGSTGLPLWIVTEANRGATTLLLPENY